MCYAIAFGSSCLGSKRVDSCKMDAEDDLFEDEATLDWSLKYVVICLLLTLGLGVAALGY